ncbi:MAG: TetR/AcrR family transcriptional regulator [Anaerolineales bacterium]|nr:TetR/AcrR family transcriptional regulator [Anaerolineales bacterium]
MARITKKPDERRQEILAAARDLFQSAGYEQTTMQDVMDRLNIAKGTIYHYFSSKEALLEAVVEKIVDESIAGMRRAMPALKGNALEKVRFLLTAGNMADENREILDPLHQAANMEMHHRLLAVTILKLAPLYADLIRQGCAEGIFQTDAPLECAEFILSAVQFLTDQGIYPWSPEVLVRRGLAIPGIIEAQLKASPGSFHFLNPVEGSGNLK